MEEDVASVKAAVDGIRKSFTNFKRKFGNGVVSSQESMAVFEELKETLQKQYPHKEIQSPCPDIQQAWEDYNAYTDSITRITCKIVDPNTRKGLLGEGVNDKMSKARQIDSSVSRWLLSKDPLERRDIILNVEDIIKNINAAVSSQGIYTPEQREALRVFREAERYFKNNCHR